MTLSPYFKNVGILGAISGNLLLVIVFVVALINPSDHVEFIYKAPIVMYILEFINIHSLGFLYKHPGEDVGDKKKLGIAIFAFYLIFYLGVMSIFKAYTAGLLSLISLFSKFFIRKESISMGVVGISTAALFGSLFFSIFTVGFWSRIFPFPQEFSSLYSEMAFNLGGSGGFFTDVPQTGLIWGASYFICLVMLDLLICKSKARLK